MWPSRQPCLEEVRVDGEAAELGGHACSRGLWTPLLSQPRTLPGLLICGGHLVPLLIPDRAAGPRESQGLSIGHGGDGLGPGSSVPTLAAGNLLHPTLAAIQGEECWDGGQAALGPPPHPTGPELQGASCAGAECASE